MRNLGKQKPRTLGQVNMAATSDRTRTRQCIQAMIFPSHASNTPRHGQYLRLKWPELGRKDGLMLALDLDAIGHPVRKWTA